MLNIYSNLNKSQLVDKLNKLQAENLQLRQSNELFSQGPVIIFKWTNKPGWPVEFVTPNVINTFGYSDDEFINGNIQYSDLIVKSDLQQVIAEVKDASEGVVDRFDHKPYRIQHRDGTEHWLRDHTIILRDDNEITHYYGYIFDISEEINVENKLKSNKVLAQSILDNTNTLVSVKSLDGKYLQINKRFEEFFNVQRNDVIGQTDYDLFPKKEADSYRASDLKVQADQSKLVYEDTFTHDGELKSYTSEKFPLYDLNNKLFAICYVAIDITRIRKAEDALRFSESILNETQAVTHIGNWSHNPATGKSLWSEELYRLLGYQPHSIEASYDNFIKLVHPDDRNFVHDSEMELHKALDNKKSYRIEFRLLREDGEIRYLEERVNVRFDKNNKLVQLFGTTLDISERKRAEIALLKAHDELKLKLDARSSDITVLSHQIKEAVKHRIKTEKELIQRQIIFTEAIESLSDGFILLDQDDAVVMYNQRYVECYPTLRDIIKPGMKFEELVRISTERGQYKEAIGREEEWVAERIEAHNEGKCSVEQSLSDGRWFLINERKTSSGYTVGLRIEITEQKNREHKLLLSERRFRGLLDQLENIAIQGYNQHRQVIYWNRASENLYGFTEMEAIGKNLEDLIIPGDMQQLVIDSVNSWLNEGVPIPASERVLQHKNGSGVPVYSSHVMQTEKPANVEFFCVDVDLSLLYKSQRELGTANQVWQHTFNSVNDLIAIIDTDQHIVKVNRALIKCLGTDEEVLQGKNFFDCIYGNQLSVDFYPHAKTLQDRQTHSVEGYIKKLNGHFLITISPLIDTENKLIGSVYVAQDITVRKKDEKNRLDQVEKQKDTLLKEVHHRIKNHLQGLLGLLQQRKNTNAEISTLIDNVSTQIESIAVVYGLFGQHPGSQIHFLQMLEAIIYNADGLSETPIDTWYPEQTDGCEIDKEKAVAIALVINELIMNAIKHCHPEVKGTDIIKVILQRGDNCIDLSVINPGKLPEGFNLHKGTGLSTGLELTKFMLPSKGAKLSITQQGEDVISTLKVFAPLLINLNHK